MHKPQLASSVDNALRHGASSSCAGEATVCNEWQGFGGLKSAVMG